MEMAHLSKIKPHRLIIRGKVFAFGSKYQVSHADEQLKFADNTSYEFLR